jgi:hypothetical protein
MILPMGCGSSPSVTAAEPGFFTRNAGALEIDEAAGFAAARALELRDSGAEKGSKARKKAALHDLQEGLAALGVSHLRGAVPAHDRAVQAWFRQVCLAMERSVRQHA